MERNVGGLDRKLRAGGAVLALGVAGGAAAGGATTTALVVGIVALALGVNALTGFCLGNKLLGVNTCEWSGTEN